MNIFILKNKKRIFTAVICLAMTASLLSPVMKSRASMGTHGGKQWENKGVTEEEQRRFEYYGDAKQSYVDSESGKRIYYDFFLMLDKDKVWGANVVAEESGHEVRYTNDIEVVYRFSREFGPKACILWTGDDYIRLTSAVSGMKLAAGTTLLASTRKTVKFLGGDLECEPGVVFEALETMWNTTKLHGTFDISASSGNVVGSGIEMVGDPDFFVLKDYDVTENGEYAVDVTIPKGTKLGDAQIENDDIKWTAGVDGTWSFENPDLIPEVGTHTVDVVFSPTWNANYKIKRFSGKGRITVTEESGSGGSGSSAGSESGSGSGSGSGTSSGTGSGSESGSGSGGGSGSGSGSGGSSESETGSGGSASSGTGNGSESGSGSGGGSGSGSGSGGSASSGTGSGSESGSGSGGGSGSGSGSGGSASSGSGSETGSGGSASSGSEIGGGNGTTTDSSDISGETSSDSISPEADDAASGTAVSVVNDEGEDEIPAPTVIEKIVSDVSKIITKDAPSKVKYKKVIRNRTKATIKVKKIKGVTYQVQYSTSKKWKKSKIKNSKKVKITIKGLKRNKRYYIRVRAFRKVGGKKAYGKWSKVKKI